MPVMQSLVAHADAELVEDSDCFHRSPTGHEVNSNEVRKATSSLRQVLANYAHKEADDGLQVFFFFFFFLLVFLSFLCDPLTDFSVTDEVDRSEVKN